jgi:L-2-hydroxyglutarate oxidase LhgO
MDFIENIVIGAGVLGLATARKLQLENNNVLLIEKHGHVFSETSSRNSEVIHSGIYYEEGSLKNNLCLKGRELLYDYLKKNNIPYKKCGKLIVGNGSEDQKQKLDQLAAKAVKKNIAITVYEKSYMQKKFNFLKSTDNIFVHETGIFDSHEYGMGLLKDFENNGGLINYINALDSFKRKDGLFILSFKNTQYNICCKNLFIFSGLDTIEILEKSDFEHDLPKQILSKGDYFSYNGGIKTNLLIYPIPNELSLGTHLTCDMNGKIKFGPDSNFVTLRDYSVDEGNKASFIKRINDFIPSVKLDEIHPDYSGIRPKIQFNQKIYNDFYPIYKQFGDSFFCTMLGYESPGLTSSLATADMIFESFNGG